ncbi:MAG: TlpA family protein disulfide reductase [Candidatus Eremiobacteraeota bacterium]|nr:TlpA family protein disulfide reductase [Candidatus Eremiobacteraeota bacterium]
MRAAEVTGSPRLASAEAKASRHSSRWNRVFDAIALCAIGFALWKIFIAPRSLSAPGAHPAPHAVYERLDGAAFRLASERGRVVFLDFYASWCEPCKIELPLVERWARKNPGALVVPVDVGEPRTVAADFARRYGLRGIVLDSKSSAPALFGVQGFPTIVVIDREGDVRAKWEGLNPAIGLAMTNAKNHL